MSDSIEQLVRGLSLQSLPKCALAKPHESPLDLFKLAAADHISQTLGVSVDDAFVGVETTKPGKNNNGDLTIAIPRFRLKEKPQVLAQKVIDAFKPNEYLESVTGSGVFLNITANTGLLTRIVLDRINRYTYLENSQTGEKTEGENYPRSYGKNMNEAGKSVIVEFSSPNIAKPFHAGHLRSTIIGAFLSNIYESVGYKVLRMNYLGDWGKQFGLLAIGWERHGSDEKLDADPISHLYEIYVAINKDAEANPSIHDRAREIFKDMEDGKSDALGVWKKFRDISIRKYRETYDRLNVHFDVYSGESQVPADRINDALSQLQDKGVVKPDNGALIVDLEAQKLGKTVVRKRDGAFVYITRDIAGAAMRYDQYHFDKMVYVVASQQDLHLAQFFKVLELMDFPWAKDLLHVNYGMVLGMSTRKGTVVFLEQILEEAKDVMHAQMKRNEKTYATIEDPEASSDELGMTAVKIQDMAAKRINNYDFNWDRMTSFEGDTGPYLQYAHVRLSSVERRVKDEVVLPVPERRSEEIDTSLLVEPKARELVFLLAQWPDVIKLTHKSLEPSNIVTYCFRLSHAISSAWDAIIVKGQKKDVALARLWLFVSARDVLHDAMVLLTLRPLDRM